MSISNIGNSNVGQHYLTQQILNSKIGILCGSLKQSLVGVVNNHPYLAIGLAAATAVGVYCICSKLWPSMGQQGDRIVGMEKQIDQVDIEEQINQVVESVESRKAGLSTFTWDQATQFVSAVFAHLDLPEYCNNKKNKEVLTKRIRNVLFTHQDADLKKDVIKNIVKNFSEYMRNQLNNVCKDISEDEDFREIFGIEGDDAIQSAVLLGDETHNQGKVPIRIKLESGKKIVVKPRSMLPEMVLCSDEYGLSTFFGKYKAYDKDGYSYSDFLENKMEENTLSSSDEEDKYIGKLVLIDIIGRELGLSDLNAENIVTVKKQPTVIDGEVVNLPTSSEIYQEKGTEILEDGYKIEFNRRKQKYTANAVWRADTPSPSVLGNSFIKTKVQDLKKSGFKCSIDRQKINEAREALRQAPNRIVLVGTQDLKNCIILNREEGFQKFCGLVSDGLDRWGFEPIDDVFSSESFKQSFLEDLVNSDVPVFYFNLDEDGAGSVMFHGEVIGETPKFA